MHIKKLIIDGFKSYGKRTEIDGFDKEFTAITGLNGTGKSNILDSICFVLGITNLTQVRATSMQELIFKNGQAGITKASVSVIFDNTDPDNCPVGYENCREITVSRQVVIGGGGKNKYFINGKTVLTKKVIDLFCSIQMNVNNPNFLIMQGRITKVLNMKPMEILSMIEEASGTSLYETKRESTTKLIEKKDSKLKEMESLLQEEINPRMDKLREEQAAYMEFQQLKRDIDHLTHIHISYMYLQRKKAVENCEKAIESANLFVENSRQDIVKNIAESEAIDDECKTIQANIESESGGNLAEMEKELDAKLKTEAQASGVRKGATQEVDSEKRRLKTLQKNLSKDESALEQKTKKMSEVGDMFQQLKDAAENDKKAYEEAQKRFQAVSTGLEMDEDGKTSSLQEQLITTKTKLSEATTLVKSSEMELEFASKSLRDKERTTKTSDASYEKNTRNLESKQREVEAIKEKLSHIQYEEGTLEQLQEREHALNDECRQLSHELSRQGGQRYDVQYQDPEPGFDRRKVKGLVCRLFDVRDAQYTTALSTVGGGNLTNLVVDDEIVSKKILERGQLQQRITIIPMSKIRGGCINARRVQLAQRLVGAENCQPAINLIKFNPELTNVMEYVFGRSFICKDMAAAKKVTYHPEIMTRSVTWDGDSLEPQGTLSGGAQSRQMPILEHVAQIKAITEQLDAKRRELRQVQEEIMQIRPMAQAFNQLKQKLDATEYELESIKKLLALTSHGLHQQEMADLRTQIETLQATIVKTKEEQVTFRERIKDYEHNLADSKGYRERQLKDAKDNMAKTKSQSDKSSKEWNKHEQEAEILKLEIEELTKSIDQSKEELDACENSVKELQQKLDDLVSSSASTTEEINELKGNIKAQKDMINSQHQELRKKAARKDKLLKKNDDIELQIKKKDVELAKIRNDNKDGYDRIKHMENQYKWIETDRDYFGAKNTKYDYTKENPSEAGKKLEASQEKFNNLKKRINEKAMMLLEREEEELKDVCSRKDIVELDRKKIKGILKGLDQEKMELLRKAWKEIDKNFGGIFHALLPGAQATLVPTEGQEFYHGLNIKVGFNGVWKESLTELSGGQRSLVALSLILAMLKYKPAPIYILDEVDAALDMSHTQNIGQMLKLHFTNSQFIIVSLKDGMFNNANVIFRTKFENGVSGVIRTQNVRRNK